MTRNTSNDPRREPNPDPALIVNDPATVGADERLVGDRREAEERAEAPREGVENVPHGYDIQDTVGGQAKRPGFKGKRRGPGNEP